jgi:AcrR family transcriptional regulator
VGVAERRDREREELRAKILEAARDLFATEGYEKVTMRRIADAIEYSPTTIYHHFTDKDDLVKCLCEDDFSNLLGLLKTQPAPGDPIDWIRQLGRAYIAFGLQYPNHYRFMFMTPHPAHAIVKGENAYLLLREAVQKAIESGRFRPGDADAAAQVLWATVHGVVSLFITYGPEGFHVAPFAPDLAEQAMDAVLRGLLAEEKR